MNYKNIFILYIFMLNISLILCDVNVSYNNIIANNLKNIMYDNPNLNFTQSDTVPLEEPSPPPYDENNDVNFPGSGKSMVFLEFDTPGDLANIFPVNEGLVYLMYDMERGKVRIDVPSADQDSSLFDFEVDYSLFLRYDLNKAFLYDKSLNNCSMINLPVQIFPISNINGSNFIATEVVNGKNCYKWSWKEPILQYSSAIIPFLTDNDYNDSNNNNNNNGTYSNGKNKDSNTDEESKTDKNKNKDIPTLPLEDEFNFDVSYWETEAERNPYSLMFHIPVVDFNILNDKKRIDNLPTFNYYVFRFSFLKWITGPLSGNLFELPETCLHLLEDSNDNETEIENIYT
eukprot:TRINITY_DN34_c4_g1_i1.p1 TRINITY_DN34_c4_g1~~TRINITY_DN34_c4_g1_i1.p1  ORF type:complete len:344 (-),score=80.23 TRINITY_DN34_c4_g1_i1:161-1192(-)